MTSSAFTTSVVPSSTSLSPFAEQPKIGHQPQQVTVDAVVQCPVDGIDAVATAWQEAGRHLQQNSELIRAQRFPDWNGTSKEAMLHAIDASINPIDALALASSGVSVISRVLHRVVAMAQSVVSIAVSFARSLAMQVSPTGVVTPGLMVSLATGGTLQSVLTSLAALLTQTLQSILRLVGTCLLYTSPSPRD